MYMYIYIDIDIYLYTFTTITHKNHTVDSITPIAADKSYLMGKQRSDSEMTIFFTVHSVAIRP